VAIRTPSRTVCRSSGTPARRGRYAGDVDRKAGVVTVRRTVVDGRLKGYGKTDRSLRAVPLPARAAEALSATPARLDTPLLFPAKRGGPVALQPWRWREWNPALKAAGIEHRTPYSMRHTPTRA
jgi:integrase